MVRLMVRSDLGFRCSVRDGGREFRRDGARREVVRFSELVVGSGGVFGASCSLRMIDGGRFVVLVL